MTVLLLLLLLLLQNLYSAQIQACLSRRRGMQYDPIQGQGQGHEPLKVGNSAVFKGYLLPFSNGAGN